MDVAREVSLARVTELRRVGRLADVGDQVGRVGPAGLLVEGDFRTLEIAERHQIGVGAADLRGVVDRVGIERHGIPEHRGTEVEPLLIDDVQSPVAHRIEPPEAGRIVAQRRRVEIREDVDPVDAVDRVVLHHGTPALVVARQVLADDQPQVHPVSTDKRIGPVEDVVYREVVIPPVPEVGRDALALGVEHRNVEDIARTEQRTGRIGQDDLFEELVLEFVGDRIDAVGLALHGTEGQDGPLAARDGIDLARGARGEESLRVHVDLQVLHAPLREVHVQEHRSLADAAFPVVPAVRLGGIGLFVKPDIEVRSEETLVGGLAHVLLQIRCRNALLPRRRLVVLDTDLLQEILSFGDVARNAARRAGKAQHGDQQYAPDAPHADQSLLKSPSPGAAPDRTAKWPGCRGARSGVR